MRRLFTPAITVAALFFSLTPLLHADLIELSDGRKFSGTLTRNGENLTISTEDGQTIATKPGDIAKVTLISTLTPEELAAAEWTRITPLIKSADDIQAIISHYQNFLTKFPDAKQSPDAQAALTSYKTIALHDPVKFRGRWMPKAQINVVLKQWTDAAAPAVSLYKLGRTKEALEALKQPLADDPQNPDALTVAGLAAYRTNNLALSRIYFTSLAAADTTSFLAENNLAVISSLQKLNGESLIHYTRALQINTDNRQVLDNIAEALNTYLAAGGDKNGMVYRALLKIYEPAELRMQQQLAKQGLQRYSSTWVTKEQYATLVKYQDALKDRLAQIDAQARTARDTIAALDSQIKQADADYDTYLNMFNNFNNLLVGNRTLIIDNGYYLAQRDIAAQNMDRASRQKATLIAQREQYIASTREFFTQIDKIRSNLSPTASPYTGTQKMLDLGDANTPPTPAALPEPPALPSLPPPPPIVVAPQTPPPIVIPVPVYVPVPTRRGNP